MITEAKKNEIIDFFGIQYSRKLLPELKKMKIKSLDNKPFNSRKLNHIVNGGAENLKAEIAIEKVISNIKKIRENLTKS
jgi:hypothetical protein